MKELIKFVVKKDDADVEFSFNAPSRAALKEGELVYGRYFAECVRAKLLTNAEAILYDEQRGGIFSEQGKAETKSLQERYLAKDEELKKSDNEETRAKVTKELEALYNEYLSIKNRQDAVFSSTAESKARQHLIFHYALAMTYKDNQLFFAGKDYEARMEAFESQNTPFLEAVYARAVWYAAAYVSGVQNLSEVPFTDVK